MESEMTAKSSDLFEGTKKYCWPVTRTHIDVSLPCNKEHCQVSIAIREWLTGKYNNVTNIRSAWNGVRFDVNEKGEEIRVTGVWNNQTATKIYKFDSVYLKARKEGYSRLESLEKARRASKPFQACMIVESCLEKPPKQPMSEERKLYLAKWHATHKGEKGSESGPIGFRGALTSRRHSK
jgi:hypothetical protein